MLTTKEFDFKGKSIKKIHSHLVRYKELITPSQIAIDLNLQYYTVINALNFLEKLGIVKIITNSKNSFKFIQINKNISEGK
jgi:DNA-binding transcriptional regulator LsrR (DeoR family)